VDPLGDGLSRLELVDWMGTDWTAVRAARVSYSGDQAVVADTIRDVSLIYSLLKRGHWSCFEHQTLTVMVKAPIFIARQWMRHKSWSFNELSRRYCDGDKEPIEFYVPDDGAWRGQQPSDKQASDPATSMGWENGVVGELCDAALGVYMDLLRSGVAREQARMVLPVNLYTRFYATCNLRSALHFYEERVAITAQYEMQIYARAFGEILSDLFPETWYAWQELRGDACQD
jgi:thymidylate synthase (FAD)